MSYDCQHNREHYVDNRRLGRLQSALVVARRPSTGPIVRAWLLGEVKEGRSADLALRGATKFEVSRQAIARHIKKLVDEHVLAPSGHTRSREYHFAIQQSFFKQYKIDEKLQEHEVWSRDVFPLLTGLPANVLEICEYGVTEILNNAIDHSGSEDVMVWLDRTAVELHIRIQDAGIGIFRKLREARNLESDRQAILEITKGKVTTDPSRHTGEGIFFTSRMMDLFVILSDSLGLVHRRTQNDWLFENPKEVTRGTYVGLRIDPSSDHTMNEVFDRYRAAQDDYAFARTQIVLALAETEGGSLVSRSQAKRVMVGLDRFREVHLDFRGVPTIGPAFADEIFRVWKRTHPDTSLVPTGASEEVQKMIARAEAVDSESQARTDTSDSQPH